MAAVEVTMATPTSLPLTVVYLLPLLPQFDLNVDRFHERVPLYVTLNKKTENEIAEQARLHERFEPSTWQRHSLQRRNRSAVTLLLSERNTPFNREREAPEQKIQSLFNGLSISKLCPMFVHIQCLSRVCPLLKLNSFKT